MYEDYPSDALKEAGLRGSRVREGDDGFGWIDMLRDAAVNERARRDWGGAYPANRISTRKVGVEKKEPLTRDRIAMLKEAQAKIDLRREVEMRFYDGAGRIRRWKDIEADLAGSPKKLELARSIYAEISKPEGYVGAIHESPLQQPIREPHGQPEHSAACDSQAPKPCHKAKRFSLFYTHHEPVFRMVQAMAKEERRTVSEMVMFLVSAELARRMQESPEKPARKSFRRKGKAEKALKKHN